MTGIGITSADPSCTGNVAPVAVKGCADWKSAIRQVGKPALQRRTLYVVVMRQLYHRFLGTPFDGIAECDGSGQGVTREDRRGHFLIKIRLTVFGEMRQEAFTGGNGVNGQEGV